MQEVSNKNYEAAVFPAYEILSDKLREKKRDSATLDCPEEAPRRGSRGSIISGKVMPFPLQVLLIYYILSLLVKTDVDIWRMIHILYFDIYAQQVCYK